jgi:hypothetical protein
MAQLPFDRFGPVLDFGQQRRFDPDPAVRNLFGVGLSFPDERFKPACKSLAVELSKPLSTLPA